MWTNPQKLKIWSYLFKKLLMETPFFCAVNGLYSKIYWPKKYSVLLSILRHAFKTGYTKSRIKKSLLTWAVPMKLNLCHPFTALHGLSNLSVFRLTSYSWFSETLSEIDFQNSQVGPTWKCWGFHNELL